MCNLADAPASSCALAARRNSCKVIGTRRCAMVRTPQSGHHPGRALPGAADTILPISAVLAPAPDASFVATLVPGRASASPCGRLRQRWRAAPGVLSEWRVPPEPGRAVCPDSPDRCRDFRPGRCRRGRPRSCHQRAATGSTTRIGPPSPGSPLGPKLPLGSPFHCALPAPPAERPSRCRHDTPRRDAVQSSGQRFGGWQVLRPGISPAVRRKISGQIQRPLRVSQGGTAMLRGHGHNGVRDIHA